MEGISPWMILAILACYGLVGLSILLAVVSAGFLIARRRNPALKLFASAVLSLAIGGALFPLAMMGERDDWWPLMIAFALGLALAGIGPFVAMRRDPGSYPAALACSVASAAFVVRPLMTYGYDTWLRGFLIAGPSIALGVVGLAIALRRLEEPRSRKQMLSALALVNLTVFLLALVNSQTPSGIIYIDDPNIIVAKEQFSDLAMNTHWRWVLAAVAGSATLSAAFFSTWSRGRGRA
jgi:hypothetical protein